MLKLLIVDDEWIIRNGLMKTIPWQDWGIEVSGTAKNGSEAIQMIQDNEIDILLTDIRMPKLSGLELIEKIRKNTKNANMKIIILTGHNEFEYAKKAIRLKADEFLLKPTDPIELEKVMRETVANIKKEQSDKNDMFHLQLMKFIQNPSANLAENLSYNKSFQANYRFIKLHYKVVNNEESTLGLNSLYNPIQSIVIEEKSGEIKLLLYRIPIGLDWSSLISTLIDILNQQLELTEIYISELFKDIKEIPDKYNQLNISNHFLYTENDVKVYEYTSNNRNFELEEMIHYIKTHYHETINQSDVAKELYMSSSQFSKLFKQYVGVTFSEYLLKIRMHVAKDLLINTDLKIYEIAEKVGYVESRYFSQLFKDKTGKTPLEYREASAKSSSESKF